MAFSLRNPTLSKAASGKSASKPARRVCRVVCQANEANKLGSTVAAAALAAAVSLGCANAAFADIAGLTPCTESKAYAKRQKNEIKSLTKRLKQYDADSAPALALKATIERTEKRFANYGKAGLLCGVDGLPHLIADPGLALRYGHAGEVFIPTIGFLYVAGYIGHVGRSYLTEVRGGKDSITKEIIIDVPLALRLSAQGAIWPLVVVSQFTSGTLTEKEANITVSPR